MLPILIASILIEKLAVVFVVLAAVALCAALVELWILLKKQQIRADAVAGSLGAFALLFIFYLT
ncbi:MAG TPA: hypothetical protein VFU37_15415, partial [Pyrinomonadaceae bacterium]|nr:hypothetical protein [Pyrinomonadaceae bacterium]